MSAPQQQSTIQARIAERMRQLQLRIGEQNVSRKPAALPASKPVKKPKGPVVLIVHPTVTELKWDPAQISRRSPDGNYGCPVAGCADQTFDTTAKLLQHVQQRHPYLCHIKNPNEKSENARVVFKYCCPETTCQHHSNFSPLSSLPQLREHYFRNHAEKEHACNMCGERFGWDPDRKRHETDCGKDYKCTTCPARFHRENSLLHHERTKHGDQEVVSSTVMEVAANMTCAPSSHQNVTGQIVVDVFPSLDGLLWSPLEVESGQRVCPVPGCGLSHFKNNGALVRHIQTKHPYVELPSGKTESQAARHEKHYRCPHEGCIYSPPSQRWFSTITQLRYHYINQHAEKQFACSKCAKAFGWLRDRDAHEAECGQEFTCETCECKGERKSYSSRRALLSHCGRLQHPVPKQYEKPAKIKGKKSSSATSSANLAHASSSSTVTTSTVAGNITTTTTTSMDNSTDDISDSSSFALPAVSSTKEDSTSDSPTKRPDSVFSPTKKTKTSPAKQKDVKKQATSIPAKQQPAASPIKIGPVKQPASSPSCSSSPLKQMNDSPAKLADSSPAKSGSVPLKRSSSFRQILPKPDNFFTNSVQIQTDFCPVGTVVYQNLNRSGSRQATASIGCQATAAKKYSDRSVVNIGTQFSDQLFGSGGCGVQMCHTGTQLSGLAENLTTIDASQIAHIATQVSVDVSTNSTQLDLLSPGLFGIQPPQLQNMGVQATNQNADVSHMAVQATVRNLDVSNMAVQVTNEMADFNHMAVQATNEMADFNHMAVQATNEMADFNHMAVQVNNEMADFNHMAVQATNEMADFSHMATQACLSYITINRAPGGTSTTGTQIEGDEAETATQTALSLIRQRLAGPGQAISTQTPADILLSAMASADIPMAKSPGRKTRGRGRKSPIRKRSVASSEVQTSDCFPSQRKKRRLKPSATASASDVFTACDSTIATQTLPLAGSVLISSEGISGIVIRPADPTLSSTFMALDAARNGAENTRQDPSMFLSSNADVSVSCGIQADENSTLLSSAFSGNDAQASFNNLMPPNNPRQVSTNTMGLQADLDEFLSTYGLNTAELGVQTQDDFLTACTSEFGVQTQDDLLLDPGMVEFGVQTTPLSQEGTNSQESDYYRLAQFSSAGVQSCTDQVHAQTSTQRNSVAHCGTETEIFTLDNHTQTALVSSLDQNVNASSLFATDDTFSLHAQVNPRLFDSFDSDLSFSDCGTGTDNFFSTAHTQTVGEPGILGLDSGSDSQMSMLDCASQSDSFQSHAHTQTNIGTPSASQAGSGKSTSRSVNGGNGSDKESYSSDSQQWSQSESGGVLELAAAQANHIVVQTYDNENNSYMSTSVSGNCFSSTPGVENASTSSALTGSSSHTDCQTDFTNSASVMTETDTGVGVFADSNSQTAYFTESAAKSTTTETETDFSGVAAADMHTQTADDLLDFLMTNMETQTTEKLDEHITIDTADTQTQTSLLITPPQPHSARSPGASLSPFDGDYHGFNLVTAETQTSSAVLLDFEDGLDGEEFFDIVDMETQTTLW